MSILSTSFILTVQLDICFMRPSLHKYWLSLIDSPVVSRSMVFPSISYWPSLLTSTQCTSPAIKLYNSGFRGGRASNGITVQTSISLKPSNKNTSVFLSSHWAPGLNFQNTQPQTHRRAETARDPMAPNQNFFLDFMLGLFKKKKKSLPMPFEHFYGKIMSFAQRGATLLTVWREPVLKPDRIWRRDLNRCTDVPGLYNQRYSPCHTRWRSSFLYFSLD